MPAGKTSPLLWFSSMITRILPTPPGATARAAAGGPAGELAGVAGEELAGDGLACPPQPTASQPASVAAVSRVSPRRAGAPRSRGLAGDVPGRGTAGSGDAGEVS